MVGLLWLNYVSILHLESHRLSRSTSVFSLLSHLEMTVESLLVAAPTISTTT